jgi:hypothetical protein
LKSRKPLALSIAGGLAMKLTVTCPIHGDQHEVECTVSAETGHVLGISACSAFEPTKMVECDEECVHLINIRLDSKHGGKLSEHDPCA